MAARAGIPVVLAGLVLLAAPALCQTIEVTQGSRTFWVSPLVPLTLDLVASAGDPASLAPRAQGIASPHDEAPGLLHDGALWFFKVLEGGQDIVSFYDYGTAFATSAATGLEVSDETHVFLYLDNTGGRLYLVIIHDRPNDGDGGGADWTFGGLPPRTAVAVADDPAGTGDTYTIDGGTGEGQAHWTWLACCTDGVALGGLEGELFSIEIAPSFSVAYGGEIQTMAFLSGDVAAPAVFPMDRDVPFTITAHAPVPAHVSVRIFVRKNLARDTVTIWW